MPIGEESGGGGSVIGANAGMGKTAGNSQTTEEEHLFNYRDLADLRALIGGQIFNLAGTRGMYSRESAMKDSSKLVEGLSRQLQEKLLPQIGAAESMSGSYDSTAKAQLGNDLISRVAEQAAGLQLQTVKDYAQLEALQYQPLLEMFGLLKGAETSRKSRTNQSSSNQSFNVGFSP